MRSNTTGSYDLTSPRAQRIRRLAALAIVPMGSARGSRKAPATIPLPYQAEGDSEPSSPILKRIKRLAALALVREGIRR